MESKQGREHVYGREQGDGAKLPKAIGDLMLPGTPNAGHGTAWFNVCPAAIWSCLGLIYYY